MVCGRHSRLEAFEVDQVNDESEGTMKAVKQGRRNRGEFLVIAGNFQTREATQTRKNQRTRQPRDFCCSSEGFAGWYSAQEQRARAAARADISLS